MRVHGFRRGLATVLACAVVGTTSPSIAFADDAPAGAPTPEEIEQARTNFKEGLQLEKDGKYDAALEKFEAVAKVKNTAQVRFHIALCNEKLGRWTVAAEAYDAAAKQAEKDGNAPEVLKVAPDLAKKLVQKMPHLTITFVGDTMPDELTIDARKVDPAAAKDMPIDPGLHVVIASKGVITDREEIKIAEGEKKLLKLDLAAASSGGGAVYTDAAEKVDDKPKDLPTTTGGNGMKTAGWVLTGVGIASLGASLAFYGIRAAEVRDLEGVCTTDHRCPSTAGDSIDRAKTMTTLSRIALGVGVVSIGAGVYFLIAGSRKAEPEPAKVGTARIVPWAPNTQLGLGIEGAF